jgi:hypothetical protein
MNTKLGAIVQFIESKLQTLDGRPRRFEFTGVEFWSEDITKNFAPIGFKFERKFDQPFAQNRYHSEAPLQTKDHIELLGLLEDILRG